MTDVEFDDLGQRRDRLGGGKVEAVAGMNFEAEAPRELRAVADALPLEEDEKEMLKTDTIRAILETGEENKHGKNGDTV